MTVRVISTNLSITDHAQNKDSEKIGMIKKVFGKNADTIFYTLKKMV